MKMTPLRRCAFQAGGFVLSQTSTWGGCVAGHYLPDWLIIPVFTTSIALLGAGIALSAFAWSADEHGKWR